jgi:putative N6-adenine-specific DNA methylase
MSSSFSTTYRNVMSDLFVTCPHGFEELLQKELTSLGISKVSPRFCGVSVPESIENVFTVNYESRIATRVLWPIAEFPCSGRDDLYKHCRRISWDYFLDCNKTFAIDSNVQHPTLTNSLFAAMVVKDAICDFFRDKTGARPSSSIFSFKKEEGLCILTLQERLFTKGVGGHLLWKLLYTSP